MTEGTRAGRLTAQQLIEQACVMIESRGVRALSPESLAITVGVPVAEVWAHFPDRGAIAAAIAMDGFRELAARMASVTADDAESRLAQLGQQYIYFAWDKPTHFRLMFRSEPGADARQTLAVSASALTHLRDAVTALMGGEDEVALVSAWAVVHGVARLRMDGMIAAGHEREARGIAVATTRRLAKGLALSADPPGGQSAGRSGH
jgi:AcrR family transcriptional regulator